MRAKERERAREKERERERERKRERENKVGKAEAPFDGRLCPLLSIIIPNLLLL